MVYRFTVGDLLLYRAAYSVDSLTDYNWFYFLLLCHASQLASNVKTVLLNSSAWLHVLSVPLLRHQNSTRHNPVPRTRGYWMRHTVESQL